MIINLPAKRFSNITVTNISQRFTYMMAAKNGLHGYETKLRHGHPVYYTTQSSKRSSAPHVCLHEATVDAISGAIIVAIADSCMSVVTARSSAQRLIHVNTP